jgi:hypothetical protein
MEFTKAIRVRLVAEDIASDGSDTTLADCQVGSYEVELDGNDLCFRFKLAKIPDLQIANGPAVKSGGHSVGKRVPRLRGYGTCPTCGMESPEGSIRERRLDGYTTCGNCVSKTPNSEWKS